MTRRSRPRAYLALARVSNLPTVWTNVLAGMVAAGVGVAWDTFAVVAAAVSLLYIGGMVLNDAFDWRFDATDRPDRPIPAGEVGATAAFVAGCALLAAGVLALVFAGATVQAGIIAVALAAAILYYNYRHKRDPLGPFVMGVCRGLVYCAAAASAGRVDSTVLVWATVMAAYVVALTLVAKHADARFGWSIAYLIAGISLLDAAVIAICGSPPLALVAALGLPLTLVAQRWVKGT